MEVWRYVWGGELECKEEGGYGGIKTILNSDHKLLSCHSPIVSSRVRAMLNPGNHP